MDQVVNSLRNWARARARMADKRGRFQGSNKKDNVVACYCWCWLCLLWDGMIPCPCAHLLLLWIPMEWNDFVYYEMTFVGLLCIQFNLFIFKSLKKKKKKNLYISRERERERCERGQIWEKSSWQVRKREVDCFGFLLRRNK